MHSFLARLRAFIRDFKPRLGGNGARASGTGAVQITIRVDSDISEKVVVEPEGPGLYRLEDTPIVVNRDEDPFFAGDLIEVHPLADGTHQVIGVAERSPMRHYSRMIPRVFAESEELERFGERVVAEGGSWESAFGGLLWVHLPPTSTFDPAAELSRRIGAVKGSSADAEDVP